MNQENYISLELSKWLAENGCELAGEKWWYDNTLSKDRTYLGDAKGLLRMDKNGKPKPCFKNPINKFGVGNHVFAKYSDSKIYFYPAYHFYDILVTYKNEFWGKNQCDMEDRTGDVLRLLQQGKKDKAEKFIRVHCLFSPKNK